MHPIATLGAGALILENDRVLLVQPNYGPAKDHWTLPGGFLDSGESPEACAIRELMEETGQQGSIVAPLCVRFRLQPPDVYTVFRIARTSDAPLTKQADELVDVRFWSAHEALQSREVRPFTKLFLAYALYGHTENVPLPEDYRQKHVIYYFGSTR